MTEGNATFIQGLLAECSDSLEFRIYDETKIFADKPVAEESGKVVVQGLISNPAGLNVPVQGVDITNENFILTLWFPIEDYSEAMAAMAKFKAKIVGLTSEDTEGGTFSKWSMDVPSLASVDTMALLSFSQIDERFRFENIEYGRLQVRLYLTQVGTDSAMLGDQFTISQVDDDGTEYPLHLMQATLGRLDNTTASQYFGTLNALTGMESAQVSIQCQVIYDPSVPFEKEFKDNALANKWVGATTYKFSIEGGTAKRYLVVNPSLPFTPGGVAYMSFSLVHPRNTED